VDVIISNCVINLSSDKDRALREAFRVLKPGGRFAVSDVVVRGEMPAALRKNIELWIGCLAGAMEESEYRARLSAAGFADIEIVPMRAYTSEDARDPRLDMGAAPPEVDCRFISAFVRATKPTKG
jgi:SAM-dependent methyltransferase